MEFEVGAIVEGKVKSITNFGAFIDFEGGKSGLVHISEISDTFVRDIREHLKEGQTIMAKVISVEPSGKLALSIKRLQEGKKADIGDVAGGRSRNIAFKKSVGLKATSNRFEDMIARFKQDSEDNVNNFLKRTKRRENGKKSNHKGDF